MIGQVIRNVYYHTISLHITINSIDFFYAFNNIINYVFGNYYYLIRENESFFRFLIFSILKVWLRIRLICDLYIMTFETDSILVWFVNIILLERIS